MMKSFNIIVEGEADAVFFRQYIRHLFGEKIPYERFVILGGLDKLKSEATVQRMRSMTDNGGQNLVFLDADRDFLSRCDEIEKWGFDNNMSFVFFLLPNNKDAGALEDLLENIINPVNRPILDCWEGYEKELVKLEIPERTPPPLTTPAKKTKIYGYLEALLGESKAQKKLIKEVNRDYTDIKHWDLDAEYLKPLKDFLEKELSLNE